MSDPQVKDVQSFGMEQDSAPAVTLPGATLAACRRERGWTIEQVARQLNLAPRQIAAIERDDYDALPGMASVRGFIRAYAKLLKLDPAPLVATLGGDAALTHNPISTRKTMSEPFTEARLPTLGEQKEGLSSKWVIGLLLVLLIGVAIWAGQQGDVPVAGTVKTESPQPVAEQATASETVEQPAQTGDSVTSAETGNTEPASLVEAAPALQAAVTAPAEPAGSSEAAEAKPSAAGGQNTLVLTAVEDSWLEIKRVRNGSVLVSRIVKAGETEILEITEPVSLVVGNVAGMQATFRGAALNLRSSESSNVGRLNLK